MTLHRSHIILFCLLTFASCQLPFLQNKEVGEDTENVEAQDDEEDDDFPWDEIEGLDDDGRHSEIYDKIKSSRYLRDPYVLHTQVASELGLEKPYRKNADFLAERDSLLDNKILVYVDDGEYYRKKEFRHSYPYLTPEAVNLLEEVSRRFQKNLQKKKMPHYSLILTSCLRTEESQRSLRKVNQNATLGLTSHVYGVSFDISYWEFYRNSDGRIHRYKNLQNILNTTIREIRNEKKCLVVKETGHFCYHLTVLQ